MAYPPTYFRYIFKKDLPEWEAKGWVYCKDIMLMGTGMKVLFGLDECLIKKVKKRI